MSQKVVEERAADTASLRAFVHVKVQDASGLHLDRRVRGVRKGVSPRDEKILVPGFQNPDDAARAARRNRRAVATHVQNLVSRQPVLRVESKNLYNVQSVCINFVSCRARTFARSRYAVLARARDRFAGTGTLTKKKQKHEHFGRKSFFFFFSGARTVDVMAVGRACARADRAPASFTSAAMVCRSPGGSAAMVSTVHAVTPGVRPVTPPGCSMVSGAPTQRGTSLAPDAVVPSGFSTGRPVPPRGTRRPPQAARAMMSRVSAAPRTRATPAPPQSRAAPSGPGGADDEAHTLVLAKSVKTFGISASHIRSMVA